MNLEQHAEEMVRLSRLVDKGVEALAGQVRAYAQAERDYRLAKAQAWVEAPRDHDDRRITVPEREAWVNARTADERHLRDVAEGLKQTALEAVRSRRQQLSSWQSLLAAEREEMTFAKYGPETTP